jgi:hypothetical protein
MVLKNVTEAKSEKVKDLWLWEYFNGEDRKISDNQFHLKKHIEKDFSGKITYNSTFYGVIWVLQDDNEIGVIKKVDVI